MRALKTARLQLRPWAPDDVDALQALLVEPDVRRYLLDDQIVARSFVVDLQAHSAARFAAGSLGLWRADTTEGLVGFAGFLASEAYHPPALQLVFAVATQHARRGFGAE